jgi:hypothetical protein
MVDVKIAGCDTEGTSVHRETIDCFMGRCVCGKRCCGQSVSERAIDETRVL